MGTVTAHLYGISNCDKMRKTLSWFKLHNIDMIYHDYKKEGVDMPALEKALLAHGAEGIINKRGTTWKKLPDDVKSSLSEQTAAKIACENPSVIKRPLILYGDDVIIGFDESELLKHFDV